MKKSEMLKIIQQAIVDHNKSIGDFEGYGAYSHELILERLLEAGMLPPEIVQKVYTGHGNHEEIVCYYWEPEDE